MAVCSLATAWIAAVTLGVLTGWIMYVSAQQQLNPDNVSGPLVASLGDLLAILAMALIATVAASLPTSLLVLIYAGAAAAIVATALPMARQHMATAAVLHDGWQPILLSLAISAVTGAFMASGLESLDGGLAALLPVINGVGGNLAGIYASRNASAFHKRERPEAGETLTLLALTAPTHLTFLVPLRLLLGARTRIYTIPFTVLFLLASVLQVGGLLVIAHWLARRAVASKLDPDNHVVPYLTTLADTFGTALMLAIAAVLP